MSAGEENVGLSESYDRIMTQQDDARRAEENREREVATKNRMAIDTLLTKRLLFTAHTSTIYLSATQL